MSFADLLLLLASRSFALCKLAQRFPISAYERLFLHSTPTFDLSLEGNGVRCQVEPFREHKDHWTSGLRVAIEYSEIVLGHPLLGRDRTSTRIVAAVGATEDVNNLTGELSDRASRYRGLSSAPSRLTDLYSVAPTSDEP